MSLVAVSCYMEILNGRGQYVADNYMKFDVCVYCTAHSVF